MNNDLSPRTSRPYPRTFPISDSDADRSSPIATDEGASIPTLSSRPPRDHPRVSRLAAEDSFSTPTHQPQRRTIADMAGSRARRRQTYDYSDGDSEQERPQKRHRATDSLDRQRSPLPQLVSHPDPLDDDSDLFMRHREETGELDRDAERILERANPAVRPQALLDRLFAVPDVDLLFGGLPSPNSIASVTANASTATRTIIAPARVQAQRTLEAAADRQHLAPSPSPAQSLPPPNEPFFDRPQNPDEVRFSAMMAVTQSLSTLNQMFPSAWEREGIEAHQKLGAWLAGAPNGPPNQDGERRNCECGEGIDKRYFFNVCRHMSCEDCARQSGKCCNLIQSMVLCYPPKREECSICEEDNEVLIFSCGHTMCRRCWSRLSINDQGIHQLCPHCRVDISFGPIAKLH